MNTCPHDPRLTTGPIGQYHCPECGEMVLAGIGHIDWSLLDDPQIQEMNLGEEECH